MRICFSKLLILCAFLFGTAFFATAQGTSVNLVLTMTNGEEQSFLLSDQSQLSFEGGERLVIIDGNSTQSFELSQIRKMVCSELTDVDDNTLSKLQLFPNPSHNSFVIKGLQGSRPARIYALDGRLVKSFEAAEGVSVDISELSTGMYLLHINGQTSKLMKL